MPDVSLVIHDYSLAATIEGDGPPMLFVHGSVADRSTFSATIRRLQKSFRCIAYSRRFHPPNEPPGPNDVYDTVAQAEEMVEVIRKTAAPPVIMVGSSFGAYIGLIAALRSPELFRALVLCEPPMVPLLLHHPQGRALHDDFVHNVMEPSRALFRKGNDIEALKIFVEGVRGQPGWFDRLFPAMRMDLMRFAPELRAEFLTDNDRYMYEVTPDSLQALPIPTLLVGGQLSKPMFKAILDVLASSIEHTMRREIPGAGHLLHLQNPGAFESTLREFLRSYAIPGGE